jgi:hypothetical protein
MEEDNIHIWAFGLPTKKIYSRGQGKDLTLRKKCSWNRDVYFTF